MINKYYVGTIYNEIQTSLGEDITIDLLLLEEVINFKAFSNSEEPVFLYKDITTKKEYKISDLNNIELLSKMDRKSAISFLETYVNNLSTKSAEEKKINNKIKRIRRNLK